MKRFCLLFLITLVFHVSAQKLPLQGNLLQNGNPFNGTADFEFSITSISWTETISAVTVDGGYYSVVLGLTNPLPDSLFAESDEVSISISVNGEALSPITVYAPLLKNTIRDAEVKMYGKNGSLNTVLGNTLDNFGALYFHDDQNKQGVALQSKPTGGRLLLRQRNDGNTFDQSLLIGGTFGTGNAFMDLKGMNLAGNGTSNLVSLYTIDHDIQFNPYSNGYRRGGIDMYDNEGRLLSVFTSNRSESGPDPTGKSGYMIQYGTTTPNIELGGKFWEDNNLGFLQIFGATDNGTGWYNNNIMLEATNISSGSGAHILLRNTANGGVTNGSIDINSAGGTSEGASISLTSSTNTGTISLDGGSGAVTAVSVTQTSDERLKTNIRTLEGALDNVRHMRGVSFAWKDENMSQNNIGLIAQEVEKIYPEVIIENGEGHKSVNYSVLVSVLLEAVKELDGKLQSMKEENSDLKASLSEVQTLRSEIELIKKAIIN